MTAQISLNARLDTDAAHALAEELLPLRGSDLVLDASGSEHLGGQAIQILIMAAHSWRQDGCTLSLENLPDALSEQLASIGLPPSTFMTGETAA